MKKYVRVGVPVLIAVVIAGGFVVAWQTGLLAFSQCNGRDDSPIYDRAAQAIDQKVPNRLAEVADEIKGERGYQKDASCLAVLVMSGLRAESSIEARTYFSKLDELPASKDTIVTPLRRVGLKDVDTVESKLVDFESQKADSLNEVTF